MKQLMVKKISSQLENAEDVAALFSGAGIAYNKIDCANWADQYPYSPSVEFAIAHTGMSVLIDYRVDEKCVRAVAPSDNGKVWEDSCCEFFCSPADDNLYYNLECNCAGTLLLCCGQNREGRERASMEVLDSIARWSSLGRKPFASRDGYFSWHMSLIIPVSAFFRSGVRCLDGKTIRGNFYKCGDKTTAPHFLSWSPIYLLKPDFHRPDFFGEIHFER